MVIELIDPENPGEIFLPRVVQIQHSNIPLSDQYYKYSNRKKNK